MKKEIIKYLALIIIIVFIGLFIYPTIYRYDKLDQKWPIRINRITGNTEVLYTTGWKEIGVNKNSTSSNQPVSSPNSNLQSVDDFLSSDSNNTKIEKVEKKSEIVDVKTAELSFDDKVKISKINFSGWYVTGIIENISENKILINTLKFELYDKSEYVMAQQPSNNGFNGASLTFIEPGDSKIFSIYLNNNSSSVGKFKLYLTYTLGY